VKLAKDVLDFGLYTTDADAMLPFWQQQIGLPFDHTLPAGRGVHQHRHQLNGSVFKLNHSRDPLPESGPSGYRELWIAREGAGGECHSDPDGNRVRLMAPGSRGVTGFGVQLAVRDADAQHRFYRDALGLEAVGDRAYRWGGTHIEFETDASIPADAPTRCNAGMRAPGYRYLTVQVWDVDAEYARALERGAMPGHPPRTLGEVARIAFIRDPDGNWIEISQRATLTGPLPG
jgi:lactoylglutathione lyase